MHTEPLPTAPQVVAAYLGELARTGKSVATIKGALAAIQYFHRQAGHTLDRDDQAIASVLAGITRLCSRPIKRAPALEIDRLRTINARVEGDDVRSLRDRALILLGFFGALRRSELVALDVVGRSFVEIGAEGLSVHVTGSKASAATETVPIPRRDDELCAARALERYLAATCLRSGPLFRPISKAGRLLDRRLEATAVRHILRQRAGKTSLSPHSLRSGFITSAAKHGTPEHVIQRTSRHKSVDVLRSYIRGADTFAEAAAGRL
jgi:integrase